MMHFATPGTDDQIRQMAAGLDDLYRNLDLPERQVVALRLAFDEAVTNAVKHGNSGDRAKPITVDCEWNPAAIVMTITDQGNGFKCKRLPDPTRRCNLLKDCGRGLYIISAIMSDVQFNDAGNQIRMTLKRAEGGGQKAEGKSAGDMNR